MTEQGIDIFRLIIAAVNGLLFAFGIYQVLYVLQIRPNRLRRRIAKLILDIGELERSVETMAQGLEVEETESEEEELLRKKRRNCMNFAGNCEVIFRTRKT